MKALINSVSKLLAATWDLLRGLFGWLYDQIYDLADKYLNIPTWVWTLFANIGAACVAMFAMSKQIMQWLLSLLEAFSQKLAEFPPMESMDLDPGAAAEVLGGINIFCPLQEMFSLLAAFFAVSLLCLAIRGIKSLIPGLT